MENVWKFVKWDIPSLESIKGCRAYLLRERLNKGEKLNRFEKNWITQAVNRNAYFKNGIPVKGWAFDFSDVLHRFWVSQHNVIVEYYATDKKALVEMISDDYDEIVKLNK